MYILKMRVETDYGNGFVNINPSSHFGCWRAIEPANAELGGGRKETGWYVIEKIGFASREEAARALGDAVWDDGTGYSDPIKVGEGILDRFGYPKE